MGQINLVLRFLLINFLRASCLAGNSKWMVVGCGLHLEWKWKWKSVEVAWKMNR